MTYLYIETEERARSFKLRPLARLSAGALGGRRGVEAKALAPKRGEKGGRGRDGENWRLYFPLGTGYNRIGGKGWKGKGERGWWRKSSLEDVRYIRLVATVPMKWNLAKHCSSEEMFAANEAKKAKKYLTPMHRDIAFGRGINSSRRAPIFLVRYLHDFCDTFFRCL